MRLRTLFALSLAWLFGAAPSFAQDAAEQARSEFEQAQAAYRNGRYRDAAERFERAYQLAPHGGAQFAAAVAWEKAGERARAADAYAAALESGQLPADKQKLARDQLDRLQQRLARIEVAAAGAGRVTLAHVAGGTTPRVIHVEPGEHALEVAWPDGQRLRETIRADASELISVRPERPERPKAAPAPEPARRTPPADSAPPAVGFAESSPPTLGFIALGGAVVLGGTGTYLLMRGLRERDEFEASGEMDDSSRTAAIELRTWSTVSFIGAAVLAVTGVVLLLDSSSAPKTGQRRTFVATPNGAAIAF